MKIVLVFLLGSISLSIFPQTNFKYIWENERQNIPGNIIEIRNQEYIISVLEYDIEVSKSYFSLLRIDNSGNLLDSKIISNERSIFLLDIIRNSDSTFLVLCNESNCLTLDSVLFKVTTMNYTFDIIQNNAYQTNEKYYDLSKYSINKDGGIVFCAQLNSNYLVDTSNYSNVILYGLSMIGDSVMAKPFYNETDQKPYQIIEKPNVSGYYLFGSTNIMNEPFRNKFITELDYNFNPIHATIDPNFMLQHWTNAKRFGTSNIIYTGFDLNPGEHYIGSVAIMDTNFNTIAYQKIEETERDTVVNLSHKYNLDFVDENNIYVTGIANMKFQLPYQQDSSWVIIANMDSNLNIRWQKKYGGDMFYMPYSTLATSDGGCMVLGFCWDYKTQQDENSIFVMKVDSTGLLASISYPVTFKNTIHPFPNPGNDYFKIDFNAQQFPVELKVFDISGKLLLSETIENKYQRIHTSGLNSGLYLIRMTDNNKIEKTVKWVKN